MGRGIAVFAPNGCCCGADTGRIGAGDGIALGTGEFICVGVCVMGFIR